MNLCNVCNRPAVRTMVQVWVDEKVTPRHDIGAFSPVFHYACVRHGFIAAPIRNLRFFEFDHVLIPREWDAFASCFEVMES